MKNLLSLLPVYLLFIFSPVVRCQSSLILNAGIYHNEGLGILMNYYDSNPQSPRTLANSFNLLSQHFNQQYG